MKTQELIIELQKLKLNEIDRRTINLACEKLANLQNKLNNK